MTLCRDARARAIQLPAWNEAMGLPRPWDQQWSLRIQQVLAIETDLLEYPDIFEGSKVMDGLVEELIEGARAEMAVVEEHGGAVEAVPYMKARLVESHRERVARIERGELKVDRPERLHRERGLAADRRRRRRHPHPRPRGRARADRGARALEGRARRGRGAQAALEELGPGRRRRGARTSCRRRSPPPRRARPPASGPRSCARSSAPTAAPTGVGGAAPAADREQLAEVRSRVDEVSEQIGHRIKILVGKPGLDGHSNGSEQIALRARDVGMEVDLPGHPPHARADRRVGAAGGRRRGRPLDPLRLPPGADPRGRPPAARGGRRRPGRRRRDHPRRPTPSACARPASPASTRPRTSTSTGSWARSSSWSRSAPTQAHPPEPSQPRRSRRATIGDERARTGTARPGCAATAAGRRTSRSRSTTTRSAASTPRSGVPTEGVDEVQESVVQCLDCMHDQPHLAFQGDRVVPIEDRWERMVAGTPWVASCTVTVDQDQVETCSGPEAAEFAHLRRLRRRRRRASSSPTSASTSTTTSGSSSTCWSSSTPARPRRRPRSSRTPPRARSRSPRWPRSHAPAGPRLRRSPLAAAEQIPSSSPCITWRS